MEKQRPSHVPNVSLLGAEGFSLWRIIRLGEPFIWLAGAAVAIVVFMITLMLAVVFFEGATFFWPRAIQKVELADGTVLAGVQRAREAYEPKDDLGRVIERIERIQLKTGNRDLTGEDFVWVDRKDIVRHELPEDAYYLERQEWGVMIATPVRMSIKGQLIEASHPGFKERFRAELKAGRKRHKRITAIERDEIGAINYSMNKARLGLRGLELKAKRSGTPTDPAAQARLQARIDAGQAEFDALSQQLAELRREDFAHTVTFVSAQGREKTMDLSYIVRATTPNTMGFFSKAWTYADRFLEFIFSDPRESNTEGGVFPAIFGTVMMSLIMTMVVVPFGVIAALYLREYAKQGPLVSAVRIAVNNLAGVPSIVFGVFGLGFFVYFVGGGIDRLFFQEALPTPTFGTGGILWASLTLALLTVPVVIVATEEALAFVPRGVRDGSLACGASKWQMIRTVVLPAAAPGILTGVILAMARGAGEVAPLMITGVVKLAPELAVDGHFPFFHAQRKFMHLGFHIYDVGFQSPNVEAAMPMVYTTTLLLIGVIVALNLVAMFIRNRLRNKYRTSAF
jgi:phosphate transport system permease protein